MTERVHKPLQPAGHRERRFDLLRVLSYAVMAGIVFGVLFPIVPIVLWAFSKRWFYPAILPTQLSLRAWEYVLSPVSRTREAVLTGGTIAVVATVLSLIIGVSAGRALGLHNFRGKRVV